MTEMEIRAATGADLPAIVELMRTGLGPGRLERSAAVFRWKHEANPFGASDVLLAVAGTKLVGLRTFMRWRVSDGERTFAAARAVDTVTHPEFRGKGIFRRLTLTLLERLPADVAFVFNTPNDKSRPGYLKMGWRDVYRPAVWVRPAGLFGAAIDPRPAEDGLRDPRLGALLAARAPSLRLRTAWTPEALRWRFGAGSGLDYRVATTPGDLHALAIYTVRVRRQRRELMVLELLLRPGPGALVRAAGLLRSLLRHERPAYAVVLPDDARVGRAVALAGFLPVPRVGPHLVARETPANPRIPKDLFRSSGWSPSAGMLELL